MILEKKNILEDWLLVRAFVERITEKKNADTNAVLFLIGVQEVGKGKKPYSKEQKQDLIHVGTCSVLCLSGYYSFSHIDDDGWPHFQLVKKLPHGKIGEQELFLKSNVVNYFKHHELI